MHITGKGMIDYLEKLDGYETDAQKALREKLAKSNKSNFAFILRPTDKIFTAKGGAVNYNVAQQKVKAIKDGVSDIADGLDIKTYLKKVVKKQYIIDPNGVLFCDINPEGEVETYVISSNEIFWYERKGNMVEAIIFEPYIKDEKEHFRVIDGETDRIYIKEGEKVYEAPNSIIDNYFGYVPAMILGDEKDHNTDTFDSIVSDVMDDADLLLRRMSVMTIHELSHLYPRYWSMAQACTRCEGEGQIVVDADADPIVYETCKSCGGTGSKTRTNPSDEVVMPFPQDGDPVITKLMGYESPDLQTAQFYLNMIKGSREEMFRSQWGTTYELGGKRETATGRFLDAQPVVDRLTDISYTFAKMHKFLLDCYGKVILNDPRYESSVTYGTRYILEGPDDVLQKYMEVSRENVSDLTRMDLKMRYIDAEYKDDPIELVKRKKLAHIEPFPTLSQEKVIDSNSIPLFLKEEKMYFPMWVQELKDEQVVLLSIEQLRKLFKSYINSKTAEYESREKLPNAGVLPGQVGNPEEGEN